MQKMPVSNSECFLEVKEIVEKWWSKLQYERKCSSTNTVSKIVNNSTEEIQDLVRELISQEIVTLIQHCYKSKEIKDIQNTCNAINGCFDNFVHAIDAARISSTQILFFIDFSLTECHKKLLLKIGAKSSTLALLELLHSISRIFILVLKLKRVQSFKREKTFNQNLNHDNDCNTEDVKKLLSHMTYRISQLLVLDDILIDTKNNLSMAGILIREILCVNKSDLIEYHQKFVARIPSVLSKQNYKVNILKFFMSSAIINSWSTDIIDVDSTNIYLNFIITLCENYSSETPLILNTSRTLFLIIQHDCFKDFVMKSTEEKVSQTITKLLSCIFMLLEHPVACVRHSAKDFLYLLASHHSLISILVNSVFELPNDKRSYFISISALANEIGSRKLIESNEELPNQLLVALHDPTIASHVSLALESMILNDSLVENNFSEWCELWIVPLLISLMKVLPIVAADIEKLLEKAFKKYPYSVLYITNKWISPKSGEELRYVITAIKISQKQGFKFRSNFNISSASFGPEIFQQGNDTDSEFTGDQWQKLISEKLLEHCLLQRDDDIRICAFSLLVETHKITKTYSENDFKLILYFLKYNLNNQQPSTRQKILALVKKMLLRFEFSKATLLKPSKNNIDLSEKTKHRLIYDEFLESLVSFCFCNIFVGCNFNRLNTVLNILMLCFDNIKNFSFNPANTSFYWSKFLIALDSSYEENKQLAVVLAKKLDFSVLHENEPNEAKLLYEKAFSLCTHMEPPDILTGSYLLQVLISLPSSKEVLARHFAVDHVVDDVHYYCIQILYEKLKKQVQLAKLDLMTAATCGAMYGTLFAIRLIIQKVNFSEEFHKGKSCNLAEWGKKLNGLVEICFDMIHLVECVVNSSSPEGHLPMDFQTDFQNLLLLNCTEESYKIESKEVTSKVKVDITDTIQKVYNNFLQKYSEFEIVISNSQYDAYETIRNLKNMLKESKVLIRKLKCLNGASEEENPKAVLCINRLHEINQKLEKHLEKLDGANTVVDWPGTAQVLLLCAWRSIKETSLYLGDFVCKLPIEAQIELELVSKNTIIKIGEELKSLLCEIKHRGAFEHAYVGFTQLVNSLWHCSDKYLSSLPKKWLEEIIQQLKSPLNDQKMKLCSTRRSAGLPFLVQAIICSEVASVKSSKFSSLQDTMQSLLGIIENGVADNSESKIHALNVLRALFKHAQLGEHVSYYVSRALMGAIRESRAASWSERNSSSLLFSSLVIRIFGVARSRDEISKKNRMTSRTFFQRYSELYNFMLSEMELVYSKENCSHGLYPKPSLYLVLLILGRLYPPPTEDSGNVDLSEFLPYINMSRKSPTMKIRELGARAVVPLIPLDRLLAELDYRFSVLSFKNNISHNERHGILLQIKALLTESTEVLEDLTKGNLEEMGTEWIEKTKWILRWEVEYLKQVFLFTTSSYIEVLHIFFKNYSCLRKKIAEVIMGAVEVQNLTALKSSELSIIPGIFLFLENFYYLKMDILANNCLSSDDSLNNEVFFKEFMYMLQCKVGEVQSIPLKILCSSAGDEAVTKSEEYDFSGIGASVNYLVVFQTKENIDRLRVKLLSNFDIVNFIVKQVNEEKCEYFKSKVIHRLWTTAVNILVMNGVIAISHSAGGNSRNFLKIDFAKSLLRSSDKILSTNALICYSIYLIDELSVKENKGMAAENRSTLCSTLNAFAHPEADVRERLAVAKILKRSCKTFLEHSIITDPVLMNIWMIPLRLILDEDPSVRLATEDLIYEMQDYVSKNIPLEVRLIDMKTLDWPQLPLVPSKAQECLLDSYINIIGKDNLLHLIVQMFLMAVSSFSEIADCDNFFIDEFGVFEKGNPNPFCEELIVSDLMCQKLVELKGVTDVEALMRTKLDLPLSSFISENLRLQSDLKPGTLMEAVEMITGLIKSTEKLKGEFSVPRLQIKNLRNALGFRESC